MKTPTKQQAGFTLIEVIVTLMVITIVMLGVYNLIIFSLKITADNKYFVEAKEMGSQKMEYINNLPYRDVGVTTGIPSGVIPENEAIERQGTYNIRTQINYVDDPMDGTEADGTDTIGTDYKEVTIEVSWESRFGPKTLSFYGKIIPRITEVEAGGGLLRIRVVDFQGNPVIGATVQIVNNDILPMVNTTRISDGNGIVDVLGAPASYEAYQITVTKLDYGIDKTYGRDAVNLNPAKPHLTVVDGVMTEESFNIDLLADLVIHTIKQNLPLNIMVNTDPSMVNQINARLVVDSSGNIYVVWQDYRDGSSSRIYAQKFNSAGARQWLPNDINFSSSMNMVFPDIAVDTLGNLFVCWNDNSNGNQDSYLVKLASLDGADMWGGAKRIDTLADNFDQYFPVMVLSDMSGIIHVTVAWTDNRNGNEDVFVKRYDTNKNPQYLDVRAGTNPAADGTSQTDPSITADSSGITYITWTDNRNGNKDIYAQKINAAGTLLWSPDKLISAASTTFDQYSAEIATDPSDYLYVAWTDERNGDKDIYLQKFSTSSVPQWAYDLKVNTDSGTANQTLPDIAINSSGIIFITWTDERLGNKDIYAQKLDTDGNFLWSADQKIGISSTTSIQTNSAIAINPSTGLPYVSWEDDRNGDYDIFLAAFDDPGIPTYIPDIPLRIISSSRIGNNPVIYEYNRVHSTDAGGRLNLEIEWDTGYTVSLVTTSTAYRLQTSDPAIPFVILPEETKNLYLYVNN